MCVLSRPADTMRTAEYRYTEWCEWNGPALRPYWDKVVGRELYDHRQDNGTTLDMDMWEAENLADRPETVRDNMDCPPTRWP